LKSKFFSNFDSTDEDNKGFKIALDRLMELSLDDLNTIIDMLPSILLAETNVQANEQIQILQDKLPDINASVVQSSITFFEFLEEHLREVMDTPEDLVFDLVENLTLLQESKRDLFLHVITRLKEVIDSTGSEVLKREYAAGVLPAFDGIGTTVEIRAIQENRFSPITSVDKYTPSISDLVGIVSINIDLDTGNEFFFQAARSDLELVIDTLRAALKDLDALESFNNK